MVPAGNKASTKFHKMSSKLCNLFIFFFKFTFNSDYFHFSWHTTSLKPTSYCVEQKLNGYKVDPGMLVQSPLCTIFPSTIFSRLHYGAASTARRLPMWRLQVLVLINEWMLNADEHSATTIRLTSGPSIEILLQFRSILLLHYLIKMT